MTQDETDVQHKPQCILAGNKYQSGGPSIATEWAVLDNCFILCHKSTSPHSLSQFLQIYQALTRVKIISNFLIHPSSIKSLDAPQGPAANLAFSSSINFSETENNILFCQLCVVHGALKKYFMCIMQSGWGPFLQHFLPPMLLAFDNTKLQSVALLTAHCQMEPKLHFCLV